MALITPAAIADACVAAGWRGGDLSVAVAVAIASSGGNPDRAGGLFAIPGVAGGDPAAAARAAYALWQKPAAWGGFPAHRSRRYLLYMPIAVPAAAAAEARAIAANPGAELGKGLPGADAVETARSALTLAVKAGAWMSNRNNWARVAQVMLGGLILGVAIAALTREPRDKVLAPMRQIREQALGVVGLAANKGKGKGKGKPASSPAPASKGKGKSKPASSPAPAKRAPAKEEAKEEAT